jgi:hypothetical protein
MSESSFLRFRPVEGRQAAEIDVFSDVIDEFKTFLLTLRSSLFCTTRRTGRYCNSRRVQVQNAQKSYSRILLTNTII